MGRKTAGKTTLRVSDIRAAIDALALIAGYPLSIDFAWKSARVRRQLEQELKIAEEVVANLWKRHATHEQNGEKVIKGKAALEVFKADMAQAMAKTIEVDLGLTEEQLRNYLDQKNDQEHAATIIHGLLPILVNDG